MVSLDVMLEIRLESLRLKFILYFTFTDRDQ